MYPVDMRGVRNMATVTWHHPQIAKYNPKYLPHLATVGRISGLKIGRSNIN